MFNAFCYVVLFFSKCRNELALNAILTILSLSVNLLDFEYEKKKLNGYDNGERTQLKNLCREH